MIIEQADIMRLNPHLDAAANFNTTYDGRVLNHNILFLFSIRSKNHGIPNLKDFAQSESACCEIELVKCGKTATLLD